MNPVEISHLTKHYPDFSLNDVTFSVPAGYVTGFVGANGSGKTTTIKAALGMIHPDSGSATTVGHERIGVVFDAQARGQDSDITSIGVNDLLCEGNTCFPARNKIMFYRDDSHLTNTAATVLQPALVSRLDAQRFDYTAR